MLGLKRLHGFLEVTTAQVHNGNYAKWLFNLNILKEVRSRFWDQQVVSRRFALRNIDLEDMRLESTNSVPTAKLPPISN
ncbi:hypothetical protein Tco_0624579 [Tanacetum coccineum]|uniref:Uncharacterized protein n=1 Tax=Tanacetum coccineum TaxID=301880 RepID=A0ABQ4WEB8_9ASTR